jgi:hypothetical protein
MAIHLNTNNTYQSTLTNYMNKLKFITFFINLVTVTTRIFLTKMALVHSGKHSSLVVFIAV